MATWGRRLTPNDDSTIPGTVICVETCTVATPDLVNPRIRTHRLRCGHAIAGRLENGKWTRESEIGFELSSLWWEWANCRRQPGKPLWIFSQDLSGLLTLTGFWELMESGKFALVKAAAQSSQAQKSRNPIGKPKPPKMGLLVDADPPTILNCWHQQGWKLLGIDLRNYWDKSPQMLAALATLPLTAIPPDDSLESEWRRYCRDASRVTQQCVSRLALWHRLHGMGHFAYTISGMALAGFRHKHLTHPIDLPASKDDRDFERRGYYNGRTEPFWLGEIRNGRFYGLGKSPYERGLFQDRPKGPFHLVDARSFYGAVAQFQSVPIRCEAEGDGWPDSDPINPPLSMDYLAEVEIQSDTQEFPVRLPDRTIIARGHFATVLCGPELQRAVDTGAIIHVGRWRRYEIQTALRAWGLSVWDDRVAASAAGDELLASVCKAMLARLHGKFLQRAHRWQIVTDVQAPGPWRKWHTVSATTGQRETYRSIGWEVQREEDAGDGKHCFPALAAYITSWGREWLRTWIRLAGKGCVLYCSTDGLILTDEGRINLEQAGIIGDYGIGSCRIVETSNDVAIYGANDYRIGDKRCLSGVPTGNTPLADGCTTLIARDSMRCTLATPPTSTYGDRSVQQIREATGDTQRLTETGWLIPQTLYDGAEKWTEKRITCPT